MKIKHLSISAAIALSLCFACDKGVEYRIDEDLDKAEFGELLPITKEMNALSGSLVVCDGENDYFQRLEGESLCLCKRNRKSGELTVLVERKWDSVSKAEVTFTDLTLKDNYLYFILFDVNENVKYAWCRVPVDASADYETICEYGYDYDGFHFDDEHIYMMADSESGEGECLSVLDIESGALTETYPLPDGFVPKFIYDGYIYGNKYATTDGTFHVQIYRCKAGSLEEELIWSDPAQMSLSFIAADSKLYISHYQGKKLYEADLDGKNPQVILENEGVFKMNFHNGKLYLLLDNGSAHASGIYSMVPGHKVLFPIYLTEGILTGPIITETGDIWFTSQIDDSGYRIGQLQYIDGKYDHHNI